MPGTLTNTGVLITRPAHQADNLASLVEAAGDECVERQQPLVDAPIKRVFLSVATGSKQHAG